MASYFSPSKPSINVDYMTWKTMPTDRFKKRILGNDLEFTKN